MHAEHPRVGALSARRIETEEKLIGKLQNAMQEFGTTLTLTLTQP